MFTINIRDVYINLPIQNIFHITKFWLNKHNIDNTITEEALHLLKVILKQKFFFSKTTNFLTRRSHCHGITHFKYYSRDLPSIF